MKAQNRFTSGREKAKTLTIRGSAQWHLDGVSIQLSDTNFVHGRGCARLLVSMSKEEALDLAMGLLKAVRG